jgi:hypothetical protein
MQQGEGVTDVMKGRRLFELCEYHDTLLQEEQTWEGREYRRNKVRMKGS